MSTSNQLKEGVMNGLDSISSSSAVTMDRNIEGGSLVTQIIVYSPSSAPSWRVTSTTSLSSLNRPWGSKGSTIAILKAHRAFGAASNRNIPILRARIDNVLNEYISIMCMCVCV